MTSSQRVVLNMLATYGRTVFGMALGLFSTRWLLAALGSVDYGLMAVVGGLITFVTFINGTTSASCAQFFSLSIGKGDAEETNRWFNTALSIHTILPSILILVGWPVGEWVIVNFLNIPPARLDTALWVFRLSLVLAFWGMSSTPYMSMFLAKQHIAEMSLWGIVASITNFCFVYWLTTYSGDTWLAFAVFTVFYNLLTGFLQVLRARHLFPECRIHFSKWYERRQLVEVFSFTGWSLFGTLGNLMRSQGIAILLNKYFNPAQFAYVNTSYSIGNAISGYTMTLSNALRGALTPEIACTEGCGDRLRMLMLANRASKFSVYLILLFAIPLMLEVDAVLVLWLKNPPELAGTFSVYILIYFLIDQITYGHIIAVLVVKKIAGFQVTLGTLTILTLPLAWGFLALGYPATSVGLAFIIITIFLSIGRLVWAKYLAGASPRKWLREVFVPCAVVLVFGLLVGWASIFLATQLGLGSGILRVGTTTLATLVSTLSLGWLMLDKSERKFLLENFRKVAGKLGVTV